VDAFGPHVDHLASWYDEVLVSGDRVVVIGTNERLHGTELGVFHLAPDGRLTHLATYHLDSWSFTGPHSYAARVAGGRLVFYAPLPGSGSGTVGPANLNVQVGPCQSAGAMTSAHSIEGTLRCRIAMPDGAMLDVDGRWSAQRPPS